jgi:ATP-dependent Clp protease ATP-binding subunit ClpX
LPVVTVLDKLNKEALVKILTEPKNALIKQYEKIFSFENVKLIFNEDTLEEIAEISMQKELGARGLRSVLEKMMMDLMFEVPSSHDIERIIITKEMVANDGKPEIKIKKQEKTA